MLCKLLSGHAGCVLRIHCEQLIHKSKRKVNQCSVLSGINPPLLSLSQCVDPLVVLAEPLTSAEAAIQQFLLLQWSFHWPPLDRDEKNRTYYATSSCHCVGSLKALALIFWLYFFLIKHVILLSRNTSQTCSVVMRQFLRFYRTGFHFAQTTHVHCGEVWASTYNSSCLWSRPPGSP